MRLPEVGSGLAEPGHGLLMQTECALINGNAETDICVVERLHEVSDTKSENHLGVFRGCLGLHWVEAWAC